MKTENFECMQLMLLHTVALRQAEMMKISIKKFSYERLNDHQS